ncbi:hypothetical protein LPJ72_005496 [Coemansia sp. Benny D160-2]|nr:hypothetical protein LPJ72_005496 [Coemansia sp. Benny D160-2]
MPLTLRQLMQDQQQAANVSTRPKPSNNSNSRLSLAGKQPLPQETDQPPPPTTLTAAAAAAATAGGELSPASLAAVGSLVGSVRTIRAMTDEVIDARKRIDEAKEEAKELEELELDLDLELPLEAEAAIVDGARSFVFLPLPLAAAAAAELFFGLGCMYSSLLSLSMDFSPSSSEYRSSMSSRLSGYSMHATRIRFMALPPGALDDLLAARVVTELPLPVAAPLASSESESPALLLLLTARMDFPGRISASGSRPRSHVFWSTDRDPHRTRGRQHCFLFAPDSSEALCCWALSGPARTRPAAGLRRASAVDAAQSPAAASSADA